MTAPKQVWVNECDYTQCTPHEEITGIRYTRADAPELLALVEEAKAALLVLVAHEPLPLSAADKLAAALSAYEALK